MGRRTAAAAVLASALVLTGCRYDGINSLDLPGTVGTGDDSYEVVVQLEHSANLVPNTPVRVGDLNVGTVTDVRLDGWTPTLTLRIRDDVRLPANATATLGQTSLLGSKHVELAPPAGVAPQGKLKDGDVIPQSRAGRFPETEEVLASVSLLLNGGGLQHADTIVEELNRALGGREQEFRELLTQLDTFTAGLDDQKADIVAAIDALDRLGGELAAQTPAIEAALQALPRGLEAFRQEEPELLRTMHELGNWGEAVAPFRDTGVPELRALFRELEPALREVAAGQDGLMPMLRLLPFVVFPLDQVDNVFHSDYFQFVLTINLTLASLDKAFLSGTPAEGSLLAIEEALRAGRNPSLQAANPLQLPVRPDTPPAEVPPGGTGAGRDEPPAPGGPSAPESGDPAQTPSEKPTEEPSEGQLGDLLDRLIGGQGQR